MQRVSFIAIMCILFATRNHPNYELILISNRDEFFERETHIATWHDGNSVLSPYDMTRHKLSSSTDSFGTWIGVNRTGRIASLLNLKRDDLPSTRSSKGQHSRGHIPQLFLAPQANESKEDFAQWDTFGKFREIYPALSESGEFNFFYGDIKQKDYRIIDSLGNTYNVLEEDDKHSFVVSNNRFEVNPSKEWKKVLQGRVKLADLIQRTSSVKDSNTMFDECFNLASEDSITDIIKTTSYRTDPTISFDSIFVPPLGDDGIEDVGLTITKGEFYGTRSQIVILVSKEAGHVSMMERVLHTSDEDIRTNSPEKPKATVRYAFDIE